MVFCIFVSSAGLYCISDIIKEYCKEITGEYGLLQSGRFGEKKPNQSEIIAGGNKDA
jgi:isocitrate/isopropylmalate dehydrogenase